MTVELRPLGVKCNIQCQYCYQNPQRDAGNVLHTYDLEKMMTAIEREGGPFAMFGGEPLLVPIEDLEVLWAWGFKKYGSNSIQTNGSLITDDHLRLFQKYNVSVGISIDGPAELNDARWAGSVQHTRQVTDRVHEVIERFCREQRPFGLIITLHRGNATHERLPAMNAWLQRLDQLGLSSAVLHILEVDHDDVGNHYALSTEENLVALRNFAELTGQLTTLRLKLFDDMRDLLLGQDERVDCVWNACDPYTTQAVRGVEGNGQRTNCGRTNKEGIEFVKAGIEGYERYLALYQTPQEHGGCQDCRFFLMCKGQCPGTAIGSDWRKRTSYCQVWMELYTQLERQLIDEGQTPLSVSPIRRQVEAALVAAWTEGHNIRLAQAVRQASAVEEERGTCRENSRENSRDTDAEEARATHPITEPSREVVASPHGSEQQSFSDRLDFKLSKFTRVAWVSDVAKDVWAPRLDRIRQAWPEIETLSVAVGIRSCAIVSLSAEQVSTCERYCTEHGLHLRSLGARPGAGTDSSNRYIVGNSGNLAHFQRSRDAADHREIGRLLGNPECCLDFFRRIWVEQGCDDTIWPMAVATVGNRDAQTTLEVNGPAQANLLWRALDIRAVPHLPCRFDCHSTVALADLFVDAARQAGYGDAMDWLLEILAWPVRWSALHGIAEVRTPILKMSTQTDATAGEYVVRRIGNRYPTEGAQGLHFPYQQSPKPLMTLSPSYRRGLQNAAESIGKCDAKSQ